VGLVLEVAVGRHLARVLVGGGGEARIQPHGLEAVLGADTVQLLQDARLERAELRRAALVRGRSGRRGERTKGRDERDQGDDPCSPCDHAERIGRSDLGNIGHMGHLFYP
jgi:hypothetical protein